MSADVIHQRMLSNTDDKFDKSKGMWTYDVEMAIAKEIEVIEGKTEDIIDKIDIEKLTGDELARRVFQQTGIKRREATYASDEVVITTTAPTIIGVGELVAADDVFYQVTETVHLPSTGDYYVHAECTQSGPIGNVPVGAINSFPVTLNNISAVRNDVAFTNGYEAESDASLRQRYYNRLQRPGKAGNPDHYREWALEVPGVGKVKVFPRWNGVLTVKVSVLDVNHDIAPQPLLQSVEGYINSEMPFGATLTVSTATYLIIDMSANFTLKNGYTWADVEPLINARLSSYYKEIAYEENLEYISHAQVGRELLSVEGIQDYSNLLLNNSTGNVAIDGEQIAKVGAITNV